MRPTGLTWAYQLLNNTRALHGSRPGPRVGSGDLTQNRGSSRVGSGWVGSGLEEQAYRRGGCRSRRNISQLVGADGGDDAGVGGSGQGEGALPLVAA